ncbi:MAG: DUF6516 family protein [Nitrospirota bacterium]|jgi:hypothetical protein
MKAREVLHIKERLQDGAIIEMVIWQLPKTGDTGGHGMKYRLYYGKGGERLVAYDNERGKGDHRHSGGRERPYRFVSVRQLVADFFADVRKARGE